MLKPTPQSSSVAHAVQTPIFRAMNSLGINKSPKETRVVVAMSGGVDSAVTAALLAEQGYEVVGITLQLYAAGADTRRKGACCAGQDIYDARRVADDLDIPHYVLNYERRFRDNVIEPFAASYARGETPIPCVLCNQTVKFRDLLATARDLGADALATGHYVRRRLGTSGPELHRAVDAGRDQSYFLFATTRDELEFLRFPLGDLTKDGVRAAAARLALPVAAKPDSQDICFVPDGNYAGIVRRLRPAAAAPGDIVDLDGNTLGGHAGIIGYTVGQRRGLKIGGPGEPRYVVRLDAGKNQVVVGPKSALAETTVHVSDVNWLGDRPMPQDSIEIAVKLRSMQAPAAATVSAQPNGDAAVRLMSPAHGVAPGQACVFYDGARVLGGGWIRRNAAPVPAHKAIGGGRQRPTNQPLMRTAPSA